SVRRVTGVTNTTTVQEQFTVVSLSFPTVRRVRVDGSHFRAIPPRSLAARCCAEKELPSHGLASQSCSPHRGPGALLADRQHPARAAADRGGQGRLPPLRRDRKS